MCVRLWLFPAWLVHRDWFPWFYPTSTFAAELLCDTVAAALTSMRQHNSTEPVGEFLGSHAASAELNLSKIKTLVHSAQSQHSENAHKLQTMFAHCITALHQLESRALNGVFAVEDGSPTKLLTDSPSKTAVAAGVREPSKALLKELQAVRVQLERSAGNVERQALKTAAVTQKLSETEAQLDTTSAQLVAAQAKLASAESQVEVLSNALKQLATSGFTAVPPAGGSEPAGLPGGRPPLDRMGSMRRTTVTVATAAAADAGGQLSSALPLKHSLSTSVAASISPSE